MPNSLASLRVINVASSLLTKKPIERIFTPFASTGTIKSEFKKYSKFKKDNKTLLTNFGGKYVK